MDNYKTEITKHNIALFYHGTNKEGIDGIIKSRFVGTECFDGYGFFLTKDFEGASLHGQYVLTLYLMIVELQTDNVNDGNLFLCKLGVENIKQVLFSVNDRRVMKDMGLLGKLLESLKK